MFFNGRSSEASNWLGPRRLRTLCPSATPNSPARLPPPIFAAKPRNHSLTSYSSCSTNYDTRMLPLFRRGERPSPLSLAPGLDCALRTLTPHSEARFGLAWVWTPPPPRLRRPGSLRVRAPRRHSPAVAQRPRRGGMGVQMVSRPRLSVSCSANGTMASRRRVCPWRRSNPAWRLAQPLGPRPPSTPPPRCLLEALPPLLSSAPPRRPCTAAAAPLLRRQCSPLPRPSTLRGCVRLEAGPAGGLARWKLVSRPAALAVLRPA